MKLKEACPQFFDQGLSSEVGPDFEYNTEELNKGIEVEMEHTNNRDMAEKIAKDHLVEDPKYYTKLIAMEKGE